MFHQQGLSTEKENEAFEEDEDEKNDTYDEASLEPPAIHFNTSDHQIDMIREESRISLSHSSTAPDLYIELSSLYFNARINTNCWMEKSRWLIYEEDYDAELKLFSSPHLSTMSIKGLKLFKTLFRNGYASFGDDIRSYVDILNLYMKSVEDFGKFTAAELTEIRHSLSLNHFHASTHSTDVANEVPMYHYNEATHSFEITDHHITAIGRRRNRSSVALSENLQRIQSHHKLSEIISPSTEGILVQVGILENILETHSMFIRLQQPITEQGLMDLYCPLRFIYIIFGPKYREEELLEIGRVFSIMMSNREFREATYNADTLGNIIDATKKFVDSSALIHLNKRITSDTLVNCLPQLKCYAQRIVVEQHQQNVDRIKAHKESRKMSKSYKTLNIENENQLKYSDKTTFDDTSAEIPTAKEPMKMSAVFKQFVPPFHQLFIDFKGMKIRYASDYRDAFTADYASVVFTGLIFTYFVVLSPAITFGALFNTLISPNMSITMFLVASGAYQFTFSILNGQPLEIIGVTPTIFVVEQVLASLSVSLSIQYEVMRFWIGLYLAALGFLFSMFNGTVVIKHFRRSVEEVYNTYYSVIYLLSALFTMFKALPYVAIPYNSTVNSTVYINDRVKFGVGGTTLFLALIMLNLCLYLMKLNRGLYLRRTLRKMLGAFNVPLGIIFIIALNRIFFTAYQMPTLNIPPSNIVNISLWFNFPPFGNVFAAPGAVHGYCFCIAFSLFTMLVIEVATSSICVTKAERKLKKPSFYSINFFLLLFIYPLISIFLGWPFYSGAMVRSNAHCLAMSRWSNKNLPGVPKKFLGQCEQRISGIIVGILVFASVFLGSALQYIPMGSMYGMFLYMGIMGISDMVLWKRLVNLMQRRKNWKEHDYLKGFPLWHIRTLVLIQSVFVIILIVLYIISQFTTYVWVLFLFPIFIFIYAMLRGYILPKWSRLNEHLSKIDKKHRVTIFDGHFIVDPKLNETDEDDLDHADDLDAVSEEEEEEEDVIY